jgi:hypothetical protein
VVVSVLRSVARRRLVNKKNPSVHATVCCKLCKSAIALYGLYFNVVKRESVCKLTANTSNHPN